MLKNKILFGFILFFLLACTYNVEKINYENEYEATDDINHNLMVNNYFSNDFMFNFFSENNKNLITNNDIIGNCVFVSIAQLLSFYDTIFNDDYICGCSLDNHNHSFSSYRAVDDMFHSAICNQCHKEIRNKHIYTSSIAKAKCKYCGFLSDDKYTPII